jgi:hypothetical protein
MSPDTQGELAPLRQALSVANAPHFELLLRVQAV